MASNSMKVSVSILNKDRLVQWFNQFTALDKNLPVEIDLKNKVLKCKLGNAERTVLIKSQIYLSEIFKVEDIDMLDLKINGSDIRWGIYAVDKVIKILKAFDSNEIKAQLHLTHDEAQGIYFLDKVSLSEDKLRFDITSMNFSLLIFLEDIKYAAITDISESIFNFELNLPTLSKITSLSTLDTDQDYLTFKSKGKNISILGKSFDFKITDSTDEGEILIKKPHFSIIDKQAWTAYVTSSNLMILKSVGSDDREILIAGIEDY